MNNFNWTSFSRKIAIKASLLDIYNAWTIPGEIEKWFLETATFFDKEQKEIGKTSSIQKGHTYAWTWYLYDMTEHGKITDTNGKDFLQFTFAGECLVDVSLRAEHDYTIVELTQKNIPTDDESKRNIRLGCHTGWSFFLLNLKSVYEGGIDLRNKDTLLKGMINN